MVILGRTFTNNYDVRKVSDNLTRMVVKTDKPDGHDFAIYHYKDDDKMFVNWIVGEKAFITGDLKKSILSIMIERLYLGKTLLDKFIEEKDKFRNA